MFIKTLNISDYITKLILQSLDEYGGTLELARNEFANKVGCAPSQINYVITSRFTPERGYSVESKRGGGGYIRITQVEVKKDNIIMHLVNCIGNEINEQTCKAILGNLYNDKFIDKNQYDIINAAILNGSLKDVDAAQKNKVRACIFKNMILCIE